jgi:RimJ/RimL family protein N-acetyltransferase
VLLSGDLSRTTITSNRLVLRSIKASDAVESFEEANATIARFMSWNPAASLEDFEAIWQERLTNMAAGRELSLVIRLASTEEFLGRASLHPADETLLETGLWIKQSAQGFGYGREAVASLTAWAARRFRPSGFLYPVVDENTPSRRLAEALGGEIIGTRRRRKPGDVERRLLLYRIPAAT